ncbi:MAG: hypothetical protein ACPG21_09225 [Crocinitomicaceae bacterium]
MITNKFKFIYAALVLLMPSFGYSQIIGASGYLIGDYVEIGFNDAEHIP